MKKLSPLMAALKILLPSLVFPCGCRMKDGGAVPVTTGYSIVFALPGIK